MQVTNLACKGKTCIVPHVKRLVHALQDLAVVVLLMLIPLLAPSETGHHGMAQIFQVQHSGESDGHLSSGQWSLSPVLRTLCCYHVVQHRQHHQMGTPQQLTSTLEPPSSYQC